MVQEIQRNDGTSKSISGMWEYDGWILTLKPCLDISRTSNRLSASTCGYAPEVNTPGTVNIWIDTDNGFAYRKLRER
jgi:hypothetical protein